MFGMVGEISLNLGHVLMNLTVDLRWENLSTNSHGDEQYFAFLRNGDRVILRPLNYRLNFESFLISIQKQSVVFMESINSPKPCILEWVLKKKITVNLRRNIT